MAFFNVKFPEEHILYVKYEGEKTYLPEYLYEAPWQNNIYGDDIIKEFHKQFEFHPDTLTFTKDGYFMAKMVGKASGTIGFYMGRKLIYDISKNKKGN